MTKFLIRYFTDSYPVFPQVRPTSTDAEGGAKLGEAAGAVNARGECIVVLVRKVILITHPSTPTSYQGVASGVSHHHPPVPSTASVTHVKLRTPGLHVPIHTRTHIPPPLLTTKARKQSPFTCTKTENGTQGAADFSSRRTTRKAA
jgi:hypothetical protein